MTNTIYVPTPLSEKPTEDGAYTVIDHISHEYYYLSEGIWYENKEYADYKIDPIDLSGSDCHWLRPVPLSHFGYTLEQVGEAWDACEKHLEERNAYPYGRRDGFKVPDRATYLNSLQPLPAAPKQ